MSTPDNTSTDFDMLMQRLAERNLSGDKIAEVIAVADKLSPEQSKKVIDRANEKLGNKELAEKDGEKTPKTPPEADLVAEGGYAGDRKKEDLTESRKSSQKSAGKDEKLETQRKNKKAKSAKDNLEQDGNARDSSAEKNSEGNKNQRLPKSENVKKTLEYLEKRKQLKGISDKDPLEAYLKLLEEKPDVQAPAYIQQKYDSDRSELLRSVDERIKTAPDGTKYSPEKLGEELYKYQTNADTKAFAEEVLKNNKNNEELQESYDEAANKTPPEEEQKKQEKEQKKENNNEPKHTSLLGRLLGRGR